MTTLYGYIALVVGLVALAGLAIMGAKRNGRIEAELDQEKANAEAAIRVAAAVNDAPRDPRELAQRLRNGGVL